jgi:RNA polymerase sigma factor (sigma-70 family)
VLERFARGDLEAFETLFRQFQDEVYGWIVRIVRDGAAAEDLTLDTFWRIYRAHARFDPRRSFRPWARRIATNVALDHLKRLPREIPLPRELPDRSPPDSVVQWETREAIAKAFAQLPPTLRLVATLALVEEHPYKEIAEALDLSENAVKLRVFRSARVLRAILARSGVRP